MLRGLIHDSTLIWLKRGNGDAHVGIGRAVVEVGGVAQIRRERRIAQRDRTGIGAVIPVAGGVDRIARAAGRTFLEAVVDQRVVGQNFIGIGEQPPRFHFLK